ncbi:hypothetical protein H2198_000256 [Neophaeococcomyces mojaviensis]|uniref:Uncharacterized protein n=1 Tax=Neophaeococcomyces mojaviensis TaxID=3383035 RepID=A0ACC3AK47_9EURO|nr:hypothetical protein H2198_000256 [Knufia sp. JES_112]
MAPPNPTGFDIKTFARAATNQELRAKDPWRRAEAWRYTGPFTRWNRLKGAFPGFGIAAGAFAVYCVYEALFLEDPHKHGHGESMAAH